MLKPTSLRNLQPWRPGQSGNPKGRPKAPRFTERERHAILAALAGVFDEVTERAAIKTFRAALTTPRTVLQALELVGRLTGELDGPSQSV